MNKYFLVRPNSFWQYGEVDIEGNYPHVKLESFAVSEDEKINSKFDYFIFEIPYKESGKKVTYSNEAIELFTKSKFDVSIGRNIETNEDMVELKSDELGLYLNKPLMLSKIEVKPSKVSGLVNYMKDNEEVFKGYSFCLDTTFASACFYREKHDESLYGPDRKSKKELRRTYTINTRY